MISTTLPNEITHTIRNNYLGYQVGSDSSTSNRIGTTLEYKQTYFVYMGMAGIPSENAIINYAHDTQRLTGQSWAEVGVFRGNFALGGTASLTKLGVVDIQAWLDHPDNTDNTVTRRGIPITLNPPARQGDHLWIGYGISGATMPLLHTPPHINPAFPGTIQTISPSVKPSDLTGPFATIGLTNTAFRPVTFKLTIY